MRSNGGMGLIVLEIVFAFKFGLIRADISRGNCLKNL